MTGLRVLLCLAALLPALSHAQAPADAGDAPTEAPEALPAPPLVGAPEDLAEQPEASGARDPDVRVSLPGSEDSERMPALAAYTLEFLGGTAGGVTLSVMGFYLLAENCQGGGCILGALLLPVGAAVGVTGGVYLTGQLLGREGGLGNTFLGVLLGSGLALVSGIVLAEAADTSDGAWVVPLLALPVMGGIFGYEATVPSGRPPKPRVMAMVGTTPGGGLSGGLAGCF